jgi:hypothetical protein
VATSPHCVVRKLGRPTAVDSSAASTTAESTNGALAAQPKPTGGAPDRGDPRHAVPAVLQSPLAGGAHSARRRLLAIVTC